MFSWAPPGARVYRLHVEVCPRCDVVEWRGFFLFTAQMIQFVTRSLFWLDGSASLTLFSKDLINLIWLFYVLGGPFISHKAQSFPSCVLNLSWISYEFFRHCQSVWSSWMLILTVAVTDFKLTAVFFCFLLVFSAANAVLTCAHLGPGPTWSSLVLPRISQMCTTSKQHMYRCTMTWSARTRNCIPLHTHLSLHTLAHGTPEVSEAHVVLCRHVCCLEVLRAGEYSSQDLLLHVQGLLCTHTLYHTHGLESTLRCCSCSVVSTIEWRCNQSVLSPV